MFEYSNILIFELLTANLFEVEYLDIRIIQLFEYTLHLFLAMVKFPHTWLTNKNKINGSNRTKKYRKGFIDGRHVLRLYSQQMF
jgi:hypothetical protein